MENAGKLRPSAVLFDLDGTLADSFGAIARALNRALREHSLPEHSLSWVRQHVGRGAVALVRDAVGAPNLGRMRAVGMRFGACYRAIYKEQTPPLPSARAVLAFVAGRTGGRVGVVSNKSTALCRAWLVHWRLAEYVTAVAGPDASGVTKPDPRAVLPVLQTLRVRPEEALLVGDMEVDVATGVAAGVPVVAVRGSGPDPAVLRQAGARAVLFELRDLPAWLVGNGYRWR